MSQDCSLAVMLPATLGTSSTLLEVNKWEGSQSGIVSVLTTVAAPPVCLYTYFTLHLEVKGLR